MKFTQHILAMLALVWAVSLGAAADPALAAGDSFFVGTCHKGGLDSQAAMTAVNALPSGAHKTITFCPGTYQVNASLMVQTSNVVVKGMKGAVITTPDNYVGSVFNASGVNNVTIENLTINPGAGYSGNLVFFANVKGAVAQKLSIDGSSALSPDQSTALTFFQTSGKMAGNQVRSWHSPALTGPAVTVQLQGSGTEKVSFTGNTISDFEHVAVDASTLGSLTATGNKISGTALNPLPAAQRGMIVEVVNKGKISGNTITGGAFPVQNNTIGLSLVSARNFQISGNKLSHWDIGIELVGGCKPTAVTTGNHVTGNQLRQVEAGIALIAPGDATCDVSADSSTITGNKLADNGLQGDLGIVVQTGNAGNGFVSTAQNEVVTGNTITGFAIGLSSPLPDPTHHVTGKFAPNKIN